MEFISNILLIEADPATRASIRTTLVKNQYQVSEATTLQSARRCLREGNFGIVVLDLTLPDGHGLELLKEIRERKPRPTVISLSEMNAPTSKALALQAGVDMFVQKPIQASRFLRLVGALIAPQEGKGSSCNSRQTAPLRGTGGSAAGSTVGC